MPGHPLGTKAVAHISASAWVYTGCTVATNPKPHSAAGDLRWMVNLGKRIAKPYRGSLRDWQNQRGEIQDSCSFCPKVAIGACIAHTGGMHEVRVCRQHYENGRRNFLEMAHAQR